MRFVKVMSVFIFIALSLNAVLYTGILDKYLPWKQIEANESDKDLTDNIQNDQNNSGNTARTPFTFSVNHTFTSGDLQVTYVSVTITPDPLRDNVSSWDITVRIKNIGSSRAMISGMAFNAYQGSNKLNENYGVTSSFGDVDPNKIIQGTLSWWQWDSATQIELIYDNPFILPGTHSPTINYSIHKPSR